jgi:hypothetical protein
MSSDLAGGRPPNAVAGARRKRDGEGAGAQAIWTPAQSLVAIG